MPTTKASLSGFAPVIGSSWQNVNCPKSRQGPAHCVEEWPLSTSALAALATPRGGDAGGVVHSVVHFMGTLKKLSKFNFHSHDSVKKLHTHFAIQQCRQIMYPYATTVLMVSFALAADKDPEKLYYFLIGFISMTIFNLFQMAKTAIHRDNVEDKRNGTRPVAVSASMYENEASMPL
jgi:hypothetical protein